MKSVQFVLAVALAAAIPISAMAFNPQPEPPGKTNNTVIQNPGDTHGLNPPSDSNENQQTNSLMPPNPGETQGFNPQPEPPGKQSNGQYTNPGDAQGFNPQPEPPGKVFNTVLPNKTGESEHPGPVPPGGLQNNGPFVNPGTLKGFNPQPEPPCRTFTGPITNPGPASNLPVGQNNPAAQDFHRQSGGPAAGGALKLPSGGQSLNSPALAPTMRGMH